MPTGPDGQKRPADVVGCAHKVFQIAVGEVVEEPSNRRTVSIEAVSERKDRSRC